MLEPFSERRYKLEYLQDTDDRRGTKGGEGIKLHFNLNICTLDGFWPR